MTAVDSQRLLLVGVGALAVLAGTASGEPAAAGVVLLGGVGGRSRGVVALAGWILAGALLGGGVGYGAHALVALPLSTAGSAGLGVALGGGLGGIVHLLSSEDPAADRDERVTVDMGDEGDREPRPADLFEDHPDPVLYVTEDGGGPVVRAANDAFEDALGLPATALSGAPLADALSPVADAEGILAAIEAGESVDVTVTVETDDGSRRFRVRQVADAADGYLLFTPVG